MRQHLSYWLHTAERNIASAPVLLSLIVLVALGLRVLYVLTYGETLYLHSDDQNYINTAYHWLNTGMFTYRNPMQPTVFITPGFPALLAAVFAAGGDVQTVRLVQAVLTTLSVLLTYLIGRDLFGQKTGLLAALVMAVYPPNLVATGLILTEPLFQVFFLAFIWRSLHLKSMGDWLLLGLIWALGTYVRPTLALLPVAILPILFWRELLSWQFPWRRLAAMVALFCLVLSPWWIRNYLAYETFIPLAVSSGNPLLLGTMPPGTTIEPDPNWVYPEVDANGFVDQYATDKFEAAYAKARILQFIQDDPASFAYHYLVTKPSMLWSTPYYWKPIPLPYLNWNDQLFIHYGLLLLSLAGLLLQLVIAKGRRTAIAVVAVIPLYFTLIHAVYYSMDRYAFPMMPLLIIWTGALAVTAAYGLTYAARRLQRLAPGWLTNARVVDRLSDSDS
ncbi:ArnT family glycosyltransferase [Heliophilum fasciatum]|uniref:Dolichyl-phosphate-mannose-protein mannosyltransferase n=1 Tax=Heliophilum fasciatum TaxID=35700 RepID=A0A4R2RMG1_9FIRM|nr:glycosyltransferase family 39 protein [Heliophilum fasciatum]MCW2277539.1 4-amino-4-deoxy-L-arabinose transferase-like glycosyltransferase [Heliophilum fasciatum]TCP65170.1 dolichyl-phosphate-mannose-protein mannosyltransferase [Heliophilum fasciatum]